MPTSPNASGVVSPPPPPDGSTRMAPPYAPAEAFIRSHLASLQAQHEGVLRRMRVESGPVVLVATGLTVLDLSGVLFSASGGLLILSLALLPALPLLALGLWLDRHEPEPAWLLLRSFLWGACVATVISGLANSTVAAVLDWEVAAISSAPIVEEAAKGAALLWVMQQHCEQLNGRLDAFIYALFVGVGFAAVENVQYYAKALSESGVGGLGLTVLLRGVMTPLLHPLYTSATALGIIAGIQRKGPVRYGLVALGYVTAVVLHAVWNSGIGILLYPVIGVPAFIWLSIRIHREARAQGSKLYTALQSAIRTGRLPADSAEQLGLSSTVSLRDWMAAAADSAHPVHARWRWRRLTWLMACDSTALQLARSHTDTSMSREAVQEASLRLLEEELGRGSPHAASRSA